MELYEKTWKEIDALPRATPIVFPIAALEQHGHHMPVFTDSLLLGEVLARVKPTFDQSVVFAPLQWFGNSEHHLDFPGSMSASPRVYLNMLRDQAENFIAHGFTRLVFINGHGGNIVPGQQATFELKQKYRQQKDLLLLSCTYWTLGAEPNKIEPSLKQDQMGHACEWETSMMLTIRPDLVKGDLKAVPDVPFGTGFAPAHRAWVMPDRSTMGHIGSPQYATAAKGEILFGAFAQAVQALLEKVIAWNGIGWDA